MSAKPLIVSLCLLACAGCAGGKPGRARAHALPSATTLPAPTLAPSEIPVILLYEDGFGREAGGPPQQPLEVAVWSDGRIVWRENNTLLRARIDPGKIEALLRRLHREGVFGNGATHYANFGPDSAFDVIEIRLPDRTLKLESWHEAFERNPKLVVTSHGVESLDGRRRDAVLEAEPAAYVRFRSIWSDVRSTVKSWTPRKASRSREPSRSAAGADRMTPSGFDAEFDALG